MPSTNPIEWTIDDVCSWLKLNDLYDVHDNFVQHAITGDALVELTREDFIEMKIERLGHQKKLEKLISQLKLKVPPSKVQQDDIESLIEGNKILEEECIKLQEKLDLQTQALKDLQNEEQHLREQAAKLEEELNAKTSADSVQAWQEQIASTSDNSKVLKDEISMLQSHMSELREVMDAKQRELCALEDQLAAKNANK